MEQAQIDELKAKHGELVSVELDGEEFVFRGPRRAEYEHWLTKSREDPIEAGRVLAQQCVVSDARAMFAAVDRKPAALGAAGGFVDAITELAGLGKTGLTGGTKKKL